MLAWIIAIGIFLFSLVTYLDCWEGTFEGGTALSARVRRDGRAPTPATGIFLEQVRIAGLGLRKSRFHLFVTRADAREFAVINPLASWIILVLVIWLTRVSLRSFTKGLLDRTLIDGGAGEVHLPGGSRHALTGVTCDVTATWADDHAFDVWLDIPGEGRMLVSTGSTRRGADALAARIEKILKRHRR